MLSLLISPVARCTSFVSGTVSTCALWLAEQSLQSLVAAQAPSPSPKLAASSDFYTRRALSQRPPTSHNTNRRVGGTWAKPASLSTAPIPSRAPIALAKSSVAPKTLHTLSRTKASAPKPRSAVIAAINSPVIPSTARTSSSTSTKALANPSSSPTVIQLPRTPIRGIPSAAPTTSLSPSGMCKKAALNAWLSEHKCELGSSAGVKAARAHGERTIALEESYERQLEAAVQRSGLKARAGTTERRARQQQRIRAHMDAYIADVVARSAVANTSAPATKPQLASSPLSVDCTTALLASPAQVRFALSTASSLRAVSLAAHHRRWASSALDFRRDALERAATHRR